MANDFIKFYKKDLIIQYNNNNTMVFGYLKADQYNINNNFILKLYMRPDHNYDWIVSLTTQSWSGGATKAYAKTHNDKSSNWNHKCPLHPRTVIFHQTYISL